jgi:hypothetical protein
MPLAATVLPRRKESPVNTFKKAGVALAISAGLFTMSAPLAHAATVQPSTAPRYTVASSKVFTANPYVQTHGDVVCPGSKVPASGGVFNVSGYSGVGVNSSYPEGQIWAVDYDNQTAYPVQFDVYAICVAPTAGRAVVSKANIVATNGQQAPGLVLCPANTKVTGGGIVSQSSGIEMNVNDSYPESNGWRVDVDNLAGVDRTFSVYAVCLPKPAGYTIRTSNVAMNYVGTVTRVSRGCAAGTVPISGGLYDSLIDTGTQLVDTFPNNTHGWTADEVNIGEVGGLVTGYVICAGT